jgi:hypothetical protein
MAQGTGNSQKTIQAASLAERRSLRGVACARRLLREAGEDRRYLLDSWCKALNLLSYKGVGGREKAVLLAYSYLRHRSVGSVEQKAAQAMFESQVEGLAKQDPARVRGLVQRLLVRERQALRV